MTRIFGESRMTKKFARESPAFAKLPPTLRYDATSQRGRHERTRKIFLLQKSQIPFPSPIRDICVIRGYFSLPTRFSASTIPENSRSSV